MATARQQQRGNGVPLLVSLPPEGGSRTKLLTSGIDGAYLAAGDAALQGGTPSIEAILRQLTSEPIDTDPWTGSSCISTQSSFSMVSSLLAAEV